MAHLRKLWLLVLFLSFLAAWRAAWQSTLLAAPHPDTEKCTVQGIVTAIPTGAPLKGVRVSLNAVGSYKSLYHAQSDATGEFSLSGVEPGKYTLSISKDAYENPDRICNSDIIQDGDDVALILGQKLSGLKFQLLAPAVVTGAVYDPTGEPLANAQVEAVNSASYNGERRVSLAAQAVTDDRGRFRVFHVKPGQYLLRVRDPSYVWQQSEEDEIEGSTNAEKQIKGFLPIYYPNTTDLSQATLFDLKPGEELAGIDFTVHSSQVLRIRGHAVNGLTGERIVNANVSAIPLPPRLLENTGENIGIDKDGRFQISNLVPGRYLLSVNAWLQPNRQRWGGWQEIDLTDSSADDVLVKVFPGHDLPGRVQLLGKVKADFSHMRVALVPRSESNYRGSSATANADGTFLLLDVMQGTYDIHIGGLPEGYYLKSAHIGSVDAADDGLTIGGEPPTSPLMLDASPGAAQVEGVVQTPNGKSACAATVVLVPDAPRRSIHLHYQSTDVDRFGHYTLTGITPGSYKLFAFDNADEAGYYDPASLQPYENLGQSAHFDEGDHRTIPLKLISTGKNNP
jgi:Carboxypeptidase regulatory-like domain